MNGRCRACGAPIAGHFWIEYRTADGRGTFTLCEPECTPEGPAAGPDVRGINEHSGPGAGGDKSGGSPAPSAVDLALQDAELNGLEREKRRRAWQLLTDTIRDPRLT